MRRKVGALLPLEISILEAGIESAVRGAPEWHGFAMARAVKEQQDARMLTAHGTLYKALDRMERGGLLESRWEDPMHAAEERRPRRRLYRVTAVGAQVLARATADAPIPPGLPEMGAHMMVVQWSLDRLAAALVRCWTCCYTAGLWA